VVDPPRCDEEGEGRGDARPLETCKGSDEEGEGRGEARGVVRGVRLLIAAP